METIRPSLISLFIKEYREFNVLDNETIKTTIEKIKCLYEEYSLIDIDSMNECKLNYPFFMLVAHYLALKHGEELGLNTNLNIASSSIDGVSVSYQLQNANDNQEYFLNKTIYGQEYLAYMRRNMKSPLYIA